MISRVLHLDPRTHSSGRGPFFVSVEHHSSSRRSSVGAPGFSATSFIMPSAREQVEDTMRPSVSSWRSSCYCLPVDKNFNFKPEAHVVRNVALGLFSLIVSHRLPLCFDKVTAILTISPETQKRSVFRLCLSR